MKKIVITRKIQLNFNYQEKEQIKEGWQTLYRWQNIVFKSANLVSSHHFIQDQVKELFYFTDETKVKLANISKDDQGILSTSNMNTTYQVLSKLYKGDIPMAIMTALNSQIVSVYNKEKKDYFRGLKSLRNYKKDMPIPIRSTDIINIESTEDKKNYVFTLYGLKFKTYFGHDLSGNKEIFDRALSKEYKFSDSSIIMRNGKIFLLAVFQFDKLEVEFKKDLICRVSLSMEYPLVLKMGKKELTIGDKQEYLYRRLAIQNALQRAQKASTFNKGGKGRHKKNAATDRYKMAEKSYVESRMHAYSAKLINLCLKFKAGIIELENLPEVIEQTKENEFLLRNWGYYGLKEKIKYKCNKYGIEVIEPKEIKVPEEK